MMRHIFLLLFFGTLFFFDLRAQINPDKIEMDLDKAIYDRSWRLLTEKRDQKEKGFYQRRVKQVEGGLFEVTDYYISESKQAASIKHYQDQFLIVPEGSVKEFSRNGRPGLTGQYAHGKKEGHWVYYWRNGRKFLEGIYKDDKRDGTWIRYDERENKIWEANFVSGIQHGLTTTWRDDGSVQSKMNFRLGKLQGPLVSYYASGAILREELYMDAERIQSKCFNEQGEEIEFFPHLVSPSYGDCNEEIEGLFPPESCSFSSMLGYISDHLEYPDRARTLGIQGTAEVSFFISAEGRIEDISLLEEVDKEIGYQCLRLVRRFADFKPGKVDGQIASIHFVIPITYVLN